MHSEISISKCQQTGLLLALDNLRDHDLMNFFLGRHYDFFLLLPSNKKLEFSMVNRAPESCQLCKCTFESKTDPVQTP